MSSISDIINEFLNETKDNIATGVSSRVASSLEVTKDEGSHKLLGWKWIGNAYQYGRGPTKNKTAGSPTLREKIESWLSGKGIASKNIKGLAYVISRKIHESGTILFRKGGAGASGILEKNINKKALNDLAERVGFSAQSEILRNL